MKELKVSLSYLSKTTGVPKPTIHGWLTGRRVMELSHLKKIATVLKISIHELVYGGPDPFEPLSQEVLQEIFSGDVRVTIHKIQKNRK